MSTYSLVLSVHLLAAAVLVGNTAIAPHIRNLLCEAASVDRARQLLLVTRRITRWDPAAAVVVLASGVYLGAAGWWTEGWFYLSIAAWIANLLLAVFIVDRLRAAWLLATEHPDGPELLALDAGRRSARWNGALASMGANDVAMIFLMVMKPGLSGALAFVVVANALALLAFIGTRPQTQPLRMPGDVV